MYNQATSFLISFLGSGGHNPLSLVIGVLCVVVSTLIYLPFVRADAKAAGLAEAAWGSLSDCKDSVVILIGSGIGGALIKDGKVHFGRHGSAGEFSNIALSENVDMPGSL